MDYKIVERPGFTLLEKVERHTIADSENLNSIPDFWSRAQADGTIEKLLTLASDKTCVLGVCYGNRPTDDKTFDYAIAVPVEAETPVPEGLRRTAVPARTWAVFDCAGPMPDAIQALWHRIVTEFFPGSAYEPTYELDIEACPDGDMTAPDYHSEIWVPITRK